MCTRILSSANDCSLLQCEAWWWLLCHRSRIERRGENAWSAGRFREAKHYVWARQRDWEHLCWQSASIFCDHSQSDLLAIPSDRAFFRESWKIHLSCLEIWCELSFVPVGSLPPQKVVLTLTHMSCFSTWDPVGSDDHVLQLALQCCPFLKFQLMAFSSQRKGVYFLEGSVSEH